MTSPTVQRSQEHEDICAACRSTLITGVLLPDKRQVNLWYDETGIIRAIDETCAHPDRYDADIILDGSGYIAMPGLINTHTHAAMTLFRGYADDMHLQEWLSEKIWPLEAHLTAEHVYWGTKLACLEMIRSGTVAFNDMYFFMKDVARAVAESGIRAMLSHGIITFGDDDKLEGELKATEDLVHHVRSLNNPLITVAIGPHAPYTVPVQHLETCAGYSEQEKIGLHIHLAETKQEVDECQKTYGMTPAALLDKAGCLTERTVVAHGCWLTEDDCQLLGERKVSVAHNPVSNMKLATGRAMPYHWLGRHGVNVCLGTDGCSSNNNLDMLEEMKVAAICQKFFWNSDTALPAGEALYMATSAGARALGYHGGEIQVGMPADIVLLSRSHPSMVPLYNPVSNITYAALGSAVATVICQGKILMHNGYIPGEEQIVAGAAKAAEDLLSRAGVGIVQ